MRRRAVVKKDFKQETKTELTENSEDQEVSLNVNKKIFDTNEDPFGSENENLSSQSSEYLVIQSRRGQTKGKRSMKEQKKQTFRKKQQKNKKKKPQHSSKSKVPQSETSQVISKRNSNLFFSEESLKDDILGKKNKQQKIGMEEKDLQKFISEHGNLHITDYEFINQEENEGQVNGCKIRYIFEPKYKVSDGKQNDKATKIALTDDQIAQNHELFIELIRFYMNMWEDHATLSKVLI